MDVLPLQLMGADPSHWHLGSLYAVVGRPPKGDGNPSLDVDTCPRVRLLPLGCDIVLENLKTREKHFDVFDGYQR